MAKGEKQGLLEISLLTARIVLCLLLVFSVFVFLYYGFINRGETMGSDRVEFIEHWTVSDDKGNEQQVGRTYVVSQDDKTDYTIRTTLPAEIRDHEYLCFYVRRDIAVYINDELRDDFVEARDVNVPGGSIKKFYMMIPLKPSDSGAEVRMVHTSEQKDGQIVPETFVGTRSGAYNYLMHRWGSSFILAFIVQIFAIVVIIVSFVLKNAYKMKIDMMYGALGIAVLSAWIITDSFLFPFFFGVYHVNGIVNYLICFMIPFAPAIYLNAVQKGRYRKSISVILLVASVNALIWPLLHFTGICPFYYTTSFVNLILVGLAVAAITILVMDAIRGRVRSYRYTFIGFLAFLICCITELMIILAVHTTNEALPMVIGLALFLVFVVIQQVDDLRRINAEKQQAIEISKAKTQFLASMSHEIRTPINAILGMNEMILRENEDKVIGEYSRNIRTSGKMLLMLVNDVLDFSKIEAGKLEIHESRFLMSEMLYDVISLVRERADEKSLVLTTELTDEVPDELFGDEFRIRQILVNLLNNAVKYTDSGTITLLVGGKYGEEGGFELSLVVKDTGKGIPEADQPHLFEAFSRADIASNANIEGTGLGLAIVKSIVESMQGTLGVESEYGKGSEFWVKLPLHFHEKKPLRADFMERGTEQTEVTEVCGFTAPDAKVLAVDDNRSNLTIVKLFLKRTGIRPELCSTGTRAIELCREKKYDLILLDHMMPAPDGIETLHAIRRDEASLNRETKVVVLTANAVAGSRQMYLKEGFDDYLTKPLDSRMLEQTVREMLPEEKVMITSRRSGAAENMSGAAENMSGAAEGMSGGAADMSGAAEGMSGVAGDMSGAAEGMSKGASENTSGVAEATSGTAEDRPGAAGDRSGAAKVSPFRKRLSSIPGLDFDMALIYCGDDEQILEEIVADVAAGIPERVERMRKFIADKDFKAYKIEAHSVKGSMATIGMKDLSERAKKHEFAARDNDVAFVLRDAEEFIEEVEETGKLLEG